MKHFSNPCPNRSRRQKLQGETVLLHDPRTDWTYSHHPFIAHHAGNFHAMWSSGRENEDDLGQRILIAHSPDGRTWSTPTVLMDTRRGSHSECVLTACGFHAGPGGLNAYFSQFEYFPGCIRGGSRIENPPPRHTIPELQAVRSKDGSRFDPPIPLELPLLFNHGPVMTKYGALMACGHASVAQTRNPNGIDGWTFSGWLGQGPDMPEFDDTDLAGHSASGGLGPIELCEGWLHETDDGNLHLMLRSNTDFLYASQSVDGGNAWTKPEPTAFQNNQSRFQFSRLPDGRFFYVGNPDPGTPRNPLVLSLSEDGYTFDKHFIVRDEACQLIRKGKHKGGHYAYPHAIVVGGSLWIIYSIWKERISVTRIRLEDLP